MTEGHRAGEFIATKEHRRFTEFADAVRKHRYIGLCFGPAGVGKTLSARRYAKWDIAEELLMSWGERAPKDEPAYAALGQSRTVFFTPVVGGTLRGTQDALAQICARVDACIDQHSHRPGEAGPANRFDMLVVDEAERLSTYALEHIRDVFDRTGIGVILIGMPGIDRRLARYPQFYSRVGFAHHYRPLKGDELTFVLTRHWRKLGLALDDADFTDHQAIASIARITGGNFRLLHRLFVQIERVLKINDLSIITDDVVAAVRSTRVTGDN